LPHTRGTCSEALHQMRMNRVLALTAASAFFTLSLPPIPPARQRYPSSIIEGTSLEPRPSSPVCGKRERATTRDFRLAPNHRLSFSIGLKGVPHHERHQKAARDRQL